MSRGLCRPLSPRRADAGHARPAETDYTRTRKRIESPRPALWRSVKQSFDLRQQLGQSDQFLVGRLGEGQPGAAGGPLTSTPTWQNTGPVFGHVGFFFGGTA